jgi:hypothetical protein
MHSLAHTLVNSLDFRQSAAWIEFSGLLPEQVSDSRWEATLHPENAEQHLESAVQPRPAASCSKTKLGIATLTLVTAACWSVLCQCERNEAKS